MSEGIAVPASKGITLPAREIILLPMSEGIGLPPREGIALAMSCGSMLDEPILLGVEAWEKRPFYPWWERVATRGMDNCRAEHRLPGESMRVLSKPRSAPD
jgi:hypothetical protein